VNAYTGIALFGTSPSSINTIYREYLQTYLKSPLVGGRTYQIELYSSLISNAVQGDNIVSVPMQIGLTKERPFDFTADRFFGIDFRVHPSNQLYSIDPVCRDSVGWCQQRFCYTAQGGEQWLTIGNFQDNAHSDTLMFDRACCAPLWDYNMSYYFIDDVSVVELPSPLKGYSADTMVCSYPFRLTARGGFPSYEWSTGSRDSSLVITQAGTYWVRVPNHVCGGFTTDTIRVYEEVLPSFTLKDTI
jgi:hypothetical protein